MTTITQEEKNKRIKLAQAHLTKIGNSHTFRKEIEATEKQSQTEGIEAYWKLQDKLSRELSSHLIKYLGSSDATYFCLKLANILNGVEFPEEKWERIRESVKKFLAEDQDITNSDNLKKLSDEAIEENTMDGYYNLLKSFRKNYDELVKLKGNEDNADKFLALMTNVVYDRRWEEEN